MSQPTQAQTEPDVLHALAVKARLQATTDYPVYLGEDEIPTNPSQGGFPYLCAWAAGGTGIPADERLAGYAGSLTTTHQITVVALSPLDVIGAMARVRNALHRWLPSIGGRRCGDLEQDLTGPVIPTVDPTVKGPQGQPIYIAYLTFSFASTLNNS